MRLWHKYLIPFLPRQQLVSQWRECCCIARNISVNGTPNHILVNKILTYSVDHFVTYSNLVADEMESRGYTVDRSAFFKHIPKPNHNQEYKSIDLADLYKDWHNIRYFKQCFYNLQEKYDCGGIHDLEWAKLCKALDKCYPARVLRL